MDPKIKIQKYVSNRILPGFYKAVVGLQIVKVKINLLPGSTCFLSGIWGKIRQVYTPKNLLSPISLKVRKIIVLLNLF